MSDHIPELVAGVRNPATLSVCKDHADAVYFSIDRFSLRARARDITLDNLDTFTEQVKDSSLKAYLAINTVIYPEDLPAVDAVVEAAASAGIDAVIAWDPAVITRALDCGLGVHISTQANVSNWQTAEFYFKQGASRVILSRELTLEQIKDIRQHTDMELEVFVHGAMCQAVSGRCYLSAYLLGRSGNCGDCTQPCRWQWTLHGENGGLVELGGKYLLSARDLCMIEYVPELIDAGVDAFKIEGRLRNPGYAAVVSRCYREALDCCLDGSFTRERAQQWKEQMAAVYNRGFSTGFYFGVPGPDGLAVEKDMNASSVRRQAVGVVQNYFVKQGAAAVKLMEGGLAVGDSIVIEGTSTYLEQEVESLMIGVDLVQEAGKGQDVGMKVADRVRENDRVFRVERI
ncbi:MAG: U32 family peptidase [ANME-2 cluster archaeon]|jgi:putative protease|nr:U32 family peptidase [ANME-2 cluster archaeon]